MKNTLLILFLTVAFAFNSYARKSSYTNKVLSVATNGTEVITITETTSEHHHRGLAFGIRNSSTNALKTVTTNVTVSTLPTEKQIELQKAMDEWWAKEIERQRKSDEEVKRKKEEWIRRREEEKKKAEAYRNAYEFLSKPISKKEEK